MLNPVTWTLLKGETRGSSGPMSVTRVGEFPSKRKLLTAMREITGGQFTPVTRTAPHTYLVVPRK